MRHAKSRFEHMVNQWVAFRCREDGQSYERIAASAGVSVSTVKRWVGNVRAGVRKARSYP